MASDWSRARERAERRLDPAQTLPSKAIGRQGVGPKARRRRAAAIHADIEHYDHLDKALDFQQERIERALQGEELPPLSTFEEARDRADRRLTYHEVDEMIDQDPELKAAEEWAAVHSWDERAADDDPNYGTPAEGNYADYAGPADAGGDLTSFLESNLPRGGGDVG